MEEAAGEPCLMVLSCRQSSVTEELAVLKEEVVEAVVCELGEEAVDFLALVSQIEAAAVEVVV